MKTPGLLALLLLGPMVMIHGQNWSQFRGPNGDGISDGKSLPLEWSEKEHIRWKTGIHGKAWSSPVIWGAQIWLSTATEDGRQLSVVCVDRESGRIARDALLFEVEKPQFCHKFNSYASPTPVVEDGRLYVTFGSPGTACLDTRTGQTIWERRDFVCNHYRGAGSSPILHGDWLFMNFDGSDHQFLVALDKRTGKTVWQVNRSIDYKDLSPDGKPEAEGDWRKAFATPHVAMMGGAPILFSQGAKAFYAYQPTDGKELWRIEERTSHSGGTRPVIGHGMVYVPSGWSAGQLLAIRPGKPGDVLDANTSNGEAGHLQIAWKTKRNVPKKPALLLMGELLFGMDDGGIATCWDAKTGVIHWNERIGGNYSASPIGAPGRVYFCSEEGKTTVVAASAKWEKLAENQLEDGFMASPAVSENALILRTRTHLYRIEN